MVGDQDQAVANRPQEQVEDILMSEAEDEEDGQRGQAGSTSGCLGLSCGGWSIPACAGCLIVTPNFFGEAPKDWLRLLHCSRNRVHRLRYCAGMT